MIYKKTMLLIFTFVLLYADPADKWSDYWENSTPNGKINVAEEATPGLFQSAGLVWIRIYQKGISSQDLPSCVFAPSCSHFAVNSIRKYGFFKGWLLAGDRLLRCNPFVKNYNYPFNGKKFIDPVAKYEIY